MLTYEEALHNVQVRARDMIVDQVHPKIGPIKALGVAPKMSGTPLQIRTPAPWLGQHTTELLASIGRDAAAIEQLYADGVVYDKYRTEEPA